MFYFDILIYYNNYKCIDKDFVMAKVKSREEEIQEQWLKYFKNIEKENELIKLLLEYYKKIETELNKIELANLKKRNEDRFESERKPHRREQEEIKSILPAYTEFISRKELRQYLLKANTKIDEIRNKINNNELNVLSDFKQKLAHYSELKEKLEEFEREKEKPQIDKNKFTSIYLENFKGFTQKEKEKQDENTIKIRPITLIYGPNSFGKSSILQSLLLMNQTVNEGGDYRTVCLLPKGQTANLGTFSDLINKNDTSKELRIDISLPFNHYFDNENISAKQDTSLLTKLYFSYYFKLTRGHTVLSKIDIWARMIDYYNTDTIMEIPKKLVYTLELQPNQNDVYTIIRHCKNDIAPNEVFLGDTGEKQEVKKISFFRLEEFLAEEPFKQIEEILKNLVYVSSFRIQPERVFIPEQNRRDYVGKNGEYTAEILYDNDIKKDINIWLKEIAGYELSEDNGNDKVKSINLNDKKTHVQKINLLDLGSGIAQVLPIITQSFKSENNTILVEEPEIHLHPKAQATLGAMFAEATQKRNNTFIIETHSENLLLRLEKLIRRGELSEDDVSVIYVDKDENGSKCIPLELDNEGDIVNISDVPNGFFEEGFDELFDIDKDN